MDDWMKHITGFIKDLGFPIVTSLWLMYFVNKVMIINEIVQALIRIDEKIERLLLLVEREQNDSN